MHPWIVSLAWKATPPQAPASTSGSRGMEVPSLAFDALCSWAHPACVPHACPTGPNACGKYFYAISQEDSQQLAKEGPPRASFMVMADCRSGPPGEAVMSAGGPAAATLVRMTRLCSCSTTSWHAVACNGELLCIKSI